MLTIIYNAASVLTAVILYPGPDLYYYEVVECGRRMLLTGVLIFIAPHTATQVAMACIFAFASLLGFDTSTGTHRRGRKDIYQYGRKCKDCFT